MKILEINKYCIKSYLSKINFLLGRNPAIEKRADWRKFIPEPYNAVITITADFELAWAWRYSKSSSAPHKLALEKARKERENIPNILDLCEKYNVPITWAAVGHLFLKECKRNETGKAHPDLPRIGKFENEFWRFSGNDWYEFDPCTNFKDAPEWYCPDLIKMILNSKVKHEIGCHTFSHIDCRDEVCSTEVFNAEINVCKKEAKKYGVELKSFVHPGHTIGNLDNLANAGLLSFQTDNTNTLGYPFKHKNGLWELKRTYEFAFRKDWSIDYHIYRCKKIIDRAIKNNSVCNFWFHPSFDERFMDSILPEIFKHIQSKADRIYISTVSNYIDFIEKG